jgi:hypothetical protein
MKKLFHRYMQFLGISNEGVRRIYLILVPLAFFLFFILPLIQENDRHNSAKERIRENRNRYLYQNKFFPTVLPTDNDSSAIKSLYDYLRPENEWMGEFEAFDSTMAIPENRKKFYDYFSPKNEWMGTFEAFDGHIAPDFVNWWDADSTIQEAPKIKTPPLPEAELDYTTYTKYLGPPSINMPSDFISQLPQEKKHEMVKYLTNVIEPQLNREDKTHSKNTEDIFLRALSIFILFNILIKTITWVINGFKQDKKPNDQ